MTRTGVREVSARLAASLAVIFFVFAAAPAMAGDRALFNFLGYSDSGDYAAFEEFGQYDGSGGYYSHIYIVDLGKDSWVTGSPYAVEPDPKLDEDDTPLADVRAKVLAMAQPKLKSLKIGTPAETLYLLGDGMSDTAGKVATFSTPMYLGFQADAFTLRLGLTGVKSDICVDDIADLSGFTLDLYDSAGKHSLHDDSTAPLPKSRGCTTDYRIYAVLAPFQSVANLAVISTYAQGFEGPDRRFMLVPIGNLM